MIRSAGTPLLLFLVAVFCAAPVFGQDDVHLTLKERAVRDGYAKSVVFGEGDTEYGFPRLVQLSAVIAVGTLTQRGAHFTPDEEFVVTDYDFVPSKVLKGSARIGSPLPITIPGGKVHIGNAVAEAEYNGVPPVSAGNYVLFLTPSTEDGEDGIYRITMDGLAVYRVSGGRVLCVNGDGVDPKLCRLTLADFETKVEHELLDESAGS